MSIILFEKFLRGLCRQFTLGDLGEKARQFSGEIIKFIVLRDNMLGTYDYRKLASNYQDQALTIHE